MLQYQLIGIDIHMKMLFFLNVCFSFSYTNSLSSDDPFTTIKGIFKWYIGLGVLSFCLYLMAYAFWVKF